MAWANFDGDVPVVKSLPSILGWRTASWWRDGSAWYEGSVVETQAGISQQMTGERNDWVQKKVWLPPKKNDVFILLLKQTRRPTVHLLKNPIDPSKGMGSRRTSGPWVSKTTTGLDWRAGASIFEGGWTNGLCTSFVSTTKKPMRGPKSEPEPQRTNGRTKRTRYDVTGVCGFWDGSRNTMCGAGMWINVTPTLGWYTLHKTGILLMSKSLDVRC